MYPLCTLRKCTKWEGKLYRGRPETITWSPSVISVLSGTQAMCTSEVDSERDPYSEFLAGQGLKNFPHIDNIVRESNKDIRE